jgi:hypothetical protein
MEMVMVMIMKDAMMNMVILKKSKLGHLKKEL